MNGGDWRFLTIHKGYRTFILFAFKMKTDYIIEVSMIDASNN